MVLKKVSHIVNRPGRVDKRNEAEILVAEDLATVPGVPKREKDRASGTGRNDRDKKSGAGAVKLEGGKEVCDIISSIVKIGIFTTTMNTPDNKEIIVPNGNIYGGNITNYSARDTRRVDMVVGIGYDADLLKAKRILEEMVAADERILAEPAPKIAVSELADSSVNFIVRPWVNSADFWGVKFDFTENVKLRFDEEGISIPFPQMDVHLHKADSE